jgi:hypothetical protein
LDASIVETLSRAYDGEETKAHVQILTKSEFSDETAKQRLLTMNLEGVPRWKRKKDKKEEKKKRTKLEKKKKIA